MANPHARVIGPDGEQSLGSFLRQRKDASGLAVTKIVETAGISRANYYLLEKDQQRPALATIVALLGAMGLDAAIPNAEAGDDQVDLLVRTNTGEYRIDLRWTPVERRRSRERYFTSALAGAHAAIVAAGVSPTVASAVVGAAAGSSFVAAGAALPVVLPAVVGSAVFLATKRLTEQRTVETTGEVPAGPGAEPDERTQDEALAELRQTAASMPTEELEELLLLMKAMQEVRDDGS